MKMICFSLFIYLSFVNAMDIQNESFEQNVFYEKFIHHPSYENALNLAKYFYQIKDYQKAIFWAVEANEFELLEKEAWLVFINAKLKLGKHEDALRAKEEYEKLLGNYFE
ncbi:transformation system, membrane protein CtsX [Campylobacter subantarcticus LMG 24377]|uniref:Transformation system, membrane protein CtsX n=2 Tax=Campylobacter subantarcticus TaxID=497724 RepID=A0A0A8H8J8_9BACT|nr:transformation system, membrane protein CtsX [Campylobacter subantarcticus]AJC90307.1 transformation system, membrane protein CtsX [Campylobacter subantarcticus LMG 24374]AJC91968.1 transformation system, membrane protein CtsX [Campylobacter subantarcticus LMG 24377]EAJ1261213.1 transformation system, membrane protein CtsX [Campylobacter lari]MPB98729.1 transformation system, membrane protein CtsX [Campylobacter subantarcticus]